MKSSMLVSSMVGLSTLAIAEKTLFIFGDSYTTTGFNASLQQPSVNGNPLGNPPYPGNPVCSGANWVDQVVVSCANNPSSCGGSGGKIPLKAYNYAVGGNDVNFTETMWARGAFSGPIYDMVDQVGEYKDLIRQRGSAFSSDDSLYISWFGINDIFGNGVVWTSESEDDAKVALTRDINDYFGLLKQLYFLGARKFVTIGVPPIYRQPFIQVNFPDYTQKAQDLTAFWNKQVQSQVQGFLNVASGATHYFYDSAPVMNRILDNYASYGAPNNTCEIKQDSHCLWHDVIHPDVVIHQAWGKDIFASIQYVTSFFIS